MYNANTSEKKSARQAGEVLFPWVVDHFQENSSAVIGVFQFKKIASIFFFWLLLLLF